ncbi:MAG: hypothetical protein AAF721_18120 [Myxococcota bacterium]
MGLVGMFQAVAAGLAGLFTLLGVFGSLSHGDTVVTLVSVLLFGFCAVYFRQALLLQSAADHFKDVRSEPEEAHDHLVIAFQRLKPVFVLDLVAVSLMASRSLIGLVA